MSNSKSSSLAAGAGATDGLRTRKVMYNQDGQSFKASKHLYAATQTLYPRLNAHLFCCLAGVLAVSDTRVAAEERRVDISAEITCSRRVFDLLPYMVCGQWIVYLVQ